MRGRAGVQSIVHRACDRLARSSIVVSPLQSSFATDRRPRSFEPGRLPGFLALLATSPGRVHSELGIPTPCSVPSTGDHSLSTVYSALRLRGLLHPRAAFRACARSGGSLSTQHERLVAVRLPPCRQRARPRADLTIRAARWSRLDFEALLRVEQRSYRLGVSLTGLPLPSPGSISSGSTGSRPSPGYPGRSARDVAKSGLRLRARRSPPSSASWHPREGVVLSPETAHPHEFSSLPIRNFP
jgi:hypothetical protein